MPETRDRIRFTELVIWMVGGNYFVWAYHLGHTNPARIRGWLKGTNVPHDFLNLVVVFGADPKKLQPCAIRSGVNI